MATFPCLLPSNSPHLHSRAKSILPVVIICQARVERVLDHYLTEPRCFQVKPRVDPEFFTLIAVPHVPSLV